MKLTKQRLGTVVIAQKPAIRRTVVHNGLSQIAYSAEVSGWDIDFPDDGIGFFVFMRDVGDWRLAERVTGMRVHLPKKCASLEEAIKCSLTRLHEVVRLRRLGFIRQRIASTAKVSSLPYDAPTMQANKYEEDARSSMSSVPEIKF